MSWSFSFFLTTHQPPDPFTLTPNYKIEVLVTWRVAYNFRMWAFAFPPNNKMNFLSFISILYSFFNKFVHAIPIKNIDFNMQKFEHKNRTMYYMVWLYMKFLFLLFVQTSLPKASSKAAVYIFINGFLVCLYTEINEKILYTNSYQ